MYNCHKYIVFCNSVEIPQHHTVLSTSDKIFLVGRREWPKESTLALMGEITTT
jgi:hypothetical protein